MTPRRKIALIFAAAAITITGALGGYLWWLWRQWPGAGAPAQDILAGALAAFAALAAVMLYLWHFVDGRVMVPMEVLRGDAETLLHAKPGRGIAGVPSGFLEPLAGTIDALARERDTAENEMTRQIGAATARLEDEKRRLEAILRDLAEGVVVCTLDHRILLYNDAARRMLHGAGEIGLNQPMLELLDPSHRGRVTDAIGKLAGTDKAAPGAPAPVLSLEASSAGGKVLEIRLSPIREEGGDVPGYVLSFNEAPGRREAGARAGGGAGQGVPGPEHALPPRPEFYDFSLLERPAVAAETGSRALNDLDFVVFDTETTGLKPSSGDEIIQIGAVRISRGRILTGESFERLVNPGRSIPLASIRFHGITDEMVDGKPGPEIVLPAFAAFVNDAVLVAQNAAFDMKFLKLKESGTGVRFDNPVLDTLLLSAFLHPRETDHTLDALAGRYGVDIHDRHTALGDAMITASVFVGMLRMLEAQGVRSLDDALDAMRRSSEIRRRQAEF